MLLLGRHPQRLLLGGDDSTLLLDLPLQPHHHRLQSSKALGRGGFDARLVL